MDDATRRAFDQLETLLVNRLEGDRLDGRRDRLTGHPLVLEGVQRQLTQLETLLKQHEDESLLRGNELCSMIANLPERYTWTLRIPWVGWRLLTITLVPKSAPLTGAR